MAENHWRAFRLESDAIERHVIASAGWAHRLRRRADEMRVTSDGDADARRERDRLLHSAASGYTVAASYASIYSPALGEVLFWTASSLYFDLDSPRLFGAVLAACTRDRQLSQRWSSRALDRDVPTRDRLYALISILAAPDVARRDSAIMDRLAGVDQRRGAHVTELFVPASAFLDALAPLLPRDSITAQRARARSDGVVRLMDAYSAQVDLAMSFPTWRSMSGRLLPVSPEVLATLLIVAARLDNRAFDSQDARKLHGFPDTARAMAMIGHDYFTLQLEDADPAFDAAPIFKELRERRLLAR